MSKEQLQSKKEILEARLKRIESDGANIKDIPFLLAVVKRYQRTIKKYASVGPFWQEAEAALAEVESMAEEK